MCLWSSIKSELACITLDVTVFFYFNKFEYFQSLKFHESICLQNASLACPLYSKYELFVLPTCQQLVKTQTCPLTRHVYLTPEWTGCVLVDPILIFDHHLTTHTQATSCGSGTLAGQIWAQSGSDWPQIWQIRTFFRRDFSTFLCMQQN